MHDSPITLDYVRVDSSPVVAYFDNYRRHQPDVCGESAPPLPRFTDLHPKSVPRGAHPRAVKKLT
jgi:hypothetical protein